MSMYLRQLYQETYKAEVEKQASLNPFNLFGLLDSPTVEVQGPVSLAPLPPVQVSVPDPVPVALPNPVGMAITGQVPVTIAQSSPFSVQGGVDVKLPSSINVSVNAGDSLALETPGVDKLRKQIVSLLENSAPLQYAAATTAGSIGGGTLGAVIAALATEDKAKRRRNAILGAAAGAPAGAIAADTMVYLLQDALRKSKQDTGGNA